MISQIVGAVFSLIWGWINDKVPFKMYFAGLLSMSALWVIVLCSTSGRKDFTACNSSFYLSLFVILNIFKRCYLMHSSWNGENIHKRAGYSLDDLSKPSLCFSILVCTSTSIPSKLSNRLRSFTHSIWINIDSFLSYSFIDGVGYNLKEMSECLSINN